MMHKFELAVRSVEEILPQLSTEKIQKWKGILTSALIKIDSELESTSEHICDVCLLKEFGYRTELPIGWRQRGDLTICFNHEDNEIAEVLEKALDADKQHSDTVAEQSLEELMNLI